MQIRSAQPSDAAQLTRLSEQLGYASEEEQILQRLTRLLCDEDHAVYVMEVDGEVAGWVHVHGRHLIESPDFAEIGGLVVDRNYRRKGIGELLIQSLSNEKSKPAIPMTKRVPNNPRARKPKPPTNTKR
jgi:N-acetylglutamate synthase-like GNAT family acetyltransferase